MELADILEVLRQLKPGMALTEALGLAHAIQELDRNTERPEPVSIPAPGPTVDAALVATMALWAYDTLSEYDIMTCKIQSVKRLRDRFSCTLAESIAVLNALRDRILRNDPDYAPEHFGQ